MLRSVGKTFHLTTTWSSRRFVSSSPSAAAAAGTAASTINEQASSSSSSFRYAVPVSLLSLAVGFAAGRSSFRTPEEEARIQQLPKGYPLACCGDNTTHEHDSHSHAQSHGQSYGHSYSNSKSHSNSTHHDDTFTSCDESDLSVGHQKLVKTLKRIVGRKNLWDGREQTTETAAYLKGARLGSGKALAIVRPTKLKQIPEIVQESVDAGCAVLVQGSNTGLTGGSTPRYQTDGRPTVLISMKNFDTVFPIDDGEKVVCLAGVGLASLKHFVLDNFPERESHSILGSTFLNPTTAAGKLRSFVCLKRAVGG